MEAIFSSTTGRGYWNKVRASAEPLLLRVVENRDRIPSSLSIARSSKFVQLSLHPRKSSLFKVLSAEKDQIHVVEGRLLGAKPVSSQIDYCYIKLLLTGVHPKALLPADFAHFTPSSECQTSIPSCVDELYDALVARLLPLVLLSSNPNHKLLVGLAGPPGAGKSTLAHEVARRINKIWLEKASSFDSKVQPPDIAIVLPMDGFHLYRSELDAMENPEEAHARRGAPWTFNSLRLLTCLKNLRIDGSVYVPSFDHGVGDPVEDDIFVNLQFIDIDIDKAMQRVLKRHISTGKPPDIAKQRIENNDRLNAELIMKSKKNADIVIKSVDF
ncbi:putative uridine kinase C227.14 isoform X2 [Vigna angularis]|uniref:putative uridine kinase C227.14 isoform X2 n=1 Tax=Phaseolus angularis TaxID=3914 RepID=UPI0022B38EC5|nr:putative uridine kinase C227.14 isoform X2 [Vigna angularis]